MKMVSVDLSIVKHLQMGRERIEKGWCQWALKRHEGELAQYCALGAVCMAEEGSDGYYVVPELEFPARKFLVQASGDPSIADYNNEICKTGQDVLDWFDKAIEMATVEAYKGVLVDA